jgi:two-component system response regulator VicR
MKILIIEDEREIIEVVSLAFQIRWPEAELVSTHLGKKGVELVESENPDVVILDLGLPDTSGYDVLKEIRTFSSVPVLILTVRGEEADVVRGLEWGADDYMVKPFRQLELLSRVRALVRRVNPSNVKDPLVCGELRFDPSSKQLFNGREEISLTPTEASVIHHLMRNVGQVVSHSDLAESIWGDNYPDAMDALKVYIRRLREKIEVEPSQPRVILTKSGMGYLLAKPD